MSEDLFCHPAVLKAIRTVLVSRGIRGEADLDDATGNVLLGCVRRVRRTGRPPENVAAAIAIARAVADGGGKDTARKQKRRAKTDAGLTADADSHASEQAQPLDRLHIERIRAALLERLKQEQIEMLSDVGAGVEQSKLAAEEGISPAAMRKRVQKFRKIAREVLSDHGYLVAGGFAALLAGAIGLYVGLSRPRELPVSNSPPPPKELAAQQRDLATRSCNERKWKACEEALDVAAELDPEGDRGAEVRRLREAIRAGRGGGAGDGGGREE